MDILDKIKEVSDKGSETFLDVDAQQLYDKIQLLGKNVSEDVSKDVDDQNMICNQFETLIGDYLYSPFFMSNETQRLSIEVPIVFQDTKYGFKGGKFTNKQLFDNPTCNVWFKIFDLIH